MFLCPGDAEGGGHDQLRDRVRPQTGLRSHQVTLHCDSDVGLQTEVRIDFKTAFKTLLKHCAKQAPKHRKVDVKLGHKSILTMSNACLVS